MKTTLHDNLMPYLMLLAMLTMTHHISALASYAWLQSLNLMKTTLHGHILQPLHILLTMIHDISNDCAASHQNPTTLIALTMTFKVMQATVMGA